MARTDRFRQQHCDLLGMATQLQGLLSPAALAADATPARTILSKLIGSLNLHIAAEDKILYPELAAHKDPTVSAIAKKFAVEMKSTAGAVVAYNTKWATATAIKADPEGFVRDSKAIVAALADRIKRENNELYAAADKIEGKVFA
jgi:hypothetical protein